MTLSVLRDFKPIVQQRMVQKLSKVRLIEQL